MKLSETGYNLIRECEGFRPEVYLDQVGKQTVGYGHLLTAGEIAQDTFADGLTPDEAEEILTQDVQFAEDAVTSLVTVPLTQNQFDALVDFTFNLGKAALAGSTLLKLLNSGGYGAVPTELMRWNKGRIKGVLTEIPGLTVRRQKEAALWNV